MTAKIVTVICALAIAAASLTVLMWERAKPTAGELQARDVSAAAAASVDVAAARARAAELPARETALTLGLWALVIAGSCVAIGGGLAVVRAAHLRAQFVTVGLQHPAALVSGQGVMVLSGSRSEPAPVALPAPLQAPMIAAPASCPTWQALRWQVTPSSVLLGWATGAPVTGRLADLLSVGVVGRSGTGKSTLLRLIVLQAVALGADVRVFDPHGSIADDLAGLDVADTVAHIEGAAGDVLAELDRRIAQRARHERPVLLVADELPAWAGAAPRAQDCLRRVILEGRKFNLFAYISGQGLPASLFASGTLARDGLSSRFCFASSPAIARQLGFDADVARQAPGLAVGRALLDGRVTGAGGSRVIDVPWVDVTDLRAVLPGSGKRLEGAEVLPGSGAEVLPGSMTDAVQRVRNGASMTAALRDTFGVTGGRRYQELAAELRQALGMVGQP